MKDNAKPCCSCGSLPVTRYDEEIKTIACPRAECKMKPAAQGPKDEDMVVIWNWLMSELGGFTCKSSSSIRKIDA